jgi:hypothetical protein
MKRIYIFMVVCLLATLPFGMGNQGCGGGAIESGDGSGTIHLDGGESADVAAADSESDMPLGTDLSIESRACSTEEAPQICNPKSARLLPDDAMLKEAVALGEILSSNSIRMFLGSVNASDALIGLRAVDYVAGKGALPFDAKDLISVAIACDLNSKAFNTKKKNDGEGKATMRVTSDGSNAAKMKSTSNSYTQEKYVEKNPFSFCDRYMIVVEGQFSEGFDLDEHVQQLSQKNNVEVEKEGDAFVIGFSKSNLLMGVIDGMFVIAHSDWYAKALENSGRETCSAEWMSLPTDSQIKMAADFGEKGISARNVIGIKGINRIISDEPMKMISYSLGFGDRRALLDLRFWTIDNDLTSGPSMHMITEVDFELLVPEKVYDSFSSFTVQKSEMVRAATDEKKAAAQVEPAIEAK